MIEEAGLKRSPQKELRFATHATVLGHEIRNGPPTVESDRAKRVNLAALSVSALCWSCG